MDRIPFAPESKIQLFALTGALMNAAERAIAGDPGAPDFGRRRHSPGLPTVARRHSAGHPCQPIAAAGEPLSIDTNVSPRQVAGKHGYAGVPAFSHAFRQVTGRTPTEFIQKA
jgi:AraC-like DNA-binding protein